MKYLYLFPGCIEKLRFQGSEKRLKEPLEWPNSKELGECPQADEVKGR